MENADVLKSLVCPLWGLSSWYSKDAERRRGLYGASDGGDKGAPAGAVVVAVIMILFGVFTLCGIVKAFMCGSKTTNLGGSGFIWGLLGLIIPLPAIIFLFAGNCRVEDMGGWNQ